jgi:DDE superfamily endonuclease
VFGIERKRLIDFDESGYELKCTNRSYGHCHSSIRVRKPGHYTKNTKLTVIMAVEPGDPALPAGIWGSVEHPRRWFTVKDTAGTSAVEFADFCELVCSDIESQPLPVDSGRVFIWDNLSSHTSPLVYETVGARLNEVCKFDIVRRPPYQPKFGPIEYVFCELGARLRQLSKPDWTVEILRQAIQNIAASLGMDGSFDRTFQHCGYRH